MHQVPQKRLFRGWVAGAVLGLLAQAGAAQAGGIYFVKGESFEIYDEVVKGFAETLDASEWRSLPREAWLLPEAGAEADFLRRLEAAHPDLIVTIGNRATKAVGRKFPQVPVVFALVLNPERYGILRGGPRPLVGVTLDLPHREELRLFKQVVPRLRTVGLIYSDETAAAAEEARQAAAAEGLILLTQAIRNPSDVPAALNSLPDIQLLWVLPDPRVFTRENREFLFKETKQRGIHVAIFSPAYLEGAEGADLCLTLDLKAHGRQVAALALRLLENPGLPVGIEPPKDMLLYLKRGRGLNSDVRSNLRWID